MNHTQIQTLARTNFVIGMLVSLKCSCVFSTDAGTDKSISFMLTEFLYIYSIDEEIQVLGIDCFLW